MSDVPRHPTVYSSVLMPYFAELSKGSRSNLDPFAGTGKIGLFILNCSDFIRKGEVQCVVDWTSSDTESIGFVLEKGSTSLRRE